VPSDATVVFTSESFAMFAVLQSSVHEIWVRMMTSSMKDDLRYAPSDCFETFPFPPNYEANDALERVGREYYEYRAELMKKTGKGLTKTYNRFHDKYDTAPDIERLRALHDAMDRAVLESYGWRHLNPQAIYEKEFGDAPAADAGADDALLAALTVAGRGKRGAKKKSKEKYRRRWPEEDRDEVLFQLLNLNEQYAKAAPTFGSAADGASTEEDGDVVSADSEEDLDNDMDESEEEDEE
jgi:hypothetical protein